MSEIQDLALLVSKLIDEIKDAEELSEERRERIQEVGRDLYDQFDLYGHEDRRRWG